MGSCVRVLSRVIPLVGPKFDQVVEEETSREKWALPVLSPNTGGGCEWRGSEFTTRWYHRGELPVSRFPFEGPASDVAPDCAVQIQ